MEEKPEPAEQPTERKQADSEWVLRPESEAAEGPAVTQPPDCEKLYHCGTYGLV
jgi:hypothetical protein